MRLLSHKFCLKLFCGGNLMDELILQLGEFTHLVEKHGNAIHDKRYPANVEYASLIYKEGKVQTLHGSRERLEYVQKKLHDEGKKDFEVYDSHVIAMMLQGLYDINMGASPDICLTQLFMPFLTSTYIEHGTIAEKDGFVKPTDKGKQIAERFEQESPGTSGKIERTMDFMAESGEGDLLKGINFLYENTLFNWNGPIDIPELRPYFDVLKKAYLDGAKRT
jgi:hypothetical protein